MKPIYRDCAQRPVGPPADTWAIATVYSSVVNTFAMWCSHCQRDVPAKATKGGGALCAKCGAVLDGDESRDDDRVPATAFVEIKPDEQPPAWDDGSADFDLSEIELALKSCHSTTAAHSIRFDTSHGSALPIGPPLGIANQRQVEPGSNRQPQPGIWSWGLMLLGVMGLTCGGVLAGASYLPGRHDLWTTGLPVLLVGQAVLLLGLILQIERVWHNNRVNSRRLQRVDQEIADLSRSTALWATTASPSATAFYQHLAHGASPQILLADLKGQMDLLAMRTR